MNYDHLVAPPFNNVRKGFSTDSIDNNGKNNKVMNMHEGDVWIFSIFINQCLGLLHIMESC